MSRRLSQKLNLAGSLLLAHPALMDPNFRRTVVLISAHSDEGALGVVLNRPMGKVLGEFSTDFSAGDLSSVPVFNGGPVNEQQIILSAWHESEDQGAFKLYFGLDPDKARELKAATTSLSIRAFLGYSGWTGGQLEDELKQSAWVVSPVEPDLLNRLDGEALWSAILGKVNPGLRLEAEAPEDPEVN